MRMISVHLTESQLDGIGKLVDMNVFPNRSEAIRVFIREGIKAQIDLIIAVDARSLAWESMKEYLKDKKVFKIRELVANYLLQELGIKRGLSNEQFDSLRTRLSHIVVSLEKRGFIIKESCSKNRHLYRIINRKFLE